MSRRDSGYEKKELSFYPTPPWVIDALAEVVNLKFKTIWEPACGTGEMVDAIRAHGAHVYSTDIHNYGYDQQNLVHDFLAPGNCPGLVHYDGIITNPPYGERCKLAEQFIEKALTCIVDYGFVAMLLPVDFNSASTRHHLFDGCPQYAGKVVLTQRIKWFDKPVPCKPCKGTGLIETVKCKKCNGKGEKKTGPTENHAWFLWQQTWLGDRMPPREWFAPKRAA